MLFAPVGVAGLANAARVVAGVCRRITRKHVDFEHGLKGNENLEKRKQKRTACMHIRLPDPLPRD